MTTPTTIPALHPIRDLFARPITREIAPVVYFHEQAPERVAAEVSEYIITGGWNAGDPRRARIPEGIHEALVRLLRNLRAELQRPEGAELPSCWISGFFGSGKSSFAKLLGLALDGMTLPDGRSCAAALIARDDSPRAAELQEAWERLASGLDAISVVFDIGAHAANGERIHAVARRRLQERLGYCPRFESVAEYELRLERDGRWEDFLRAVEDVHGQSWSELRGSPFADELFSEAVHRLFPERFTEPMAWADAHGGRRVASDASVDTTTADLRDMLAARAPGKTLFIVIDEVSQYIHQDDNQMLALQSFIADLGQKLRGRVWLLATGQQKLEDDDPNHSISKLKDRFPPHLRVHLAPTNIRDVVHKRLLQKTPEQHARVRELARQHEARLRLHAFGGQQVDLDEFAETYPMLPGQIDLLLQITSALRLRSSRAQGDQQAIRGLLQLVGEIFRTHQLGDRELGHLVTLDMVFDVQQTALDADTQNTLAVILGHEAVARHPLAQRVVKAIALLELIQEADAWRTSHELIARCLYARLGDDSHEADVRATLQGLHELGLIGYSEQRGFKLMSSAGQEWQRERDRIPASQDDLSRALIEVLGEALKAVERPRYKRRPFPWHGLLSDGQHTNAHTLRRVVDQAAVTVHFQWRTHRPEERQLNIWIHQSSAERYALHWVVGEDWHPADSALRAWLQSREMVRRHEPRVPSLPLERQRLFYEETTRAENLRTAAAREVAEAFLKGALYFNGRVVRHQRHLGFAAVLRDAGEEILPTLYPDYIELAVTEEELRQLLPADLSGVSSVHLQLGLLSRDGGRYLPACEGDAPGRVLAWIKERPNTSGADLLQHFGGPPTGYPPDVLRAVLLGLLRGARITIQPDVGATITSVRDVGVEDLLVRGKGLLRAAFAPGEDAGPSRRDRVRIARFFEDAFHAAPDVDNDALADAAFAWLPRLRARLHELRTRATGLPVPLPASLDDLDRAVAACLSSRNVEPTVRAVLRHLDTLNAGIADLNALDAGLTDEAILFLRLAFDTRHTLARQLDEADLLDAIRTHVQALDDALNAPRPWAAVAPLGEAVSAIRERYQEARHDLVQRHNAALEATLRRLQQHPDHRALAPDKAAHLRLIIERAAFDTTANDTHPTLALLRDAGPTRLQAALDDALQRLDLLLLPPGVQTAEITLPTHGRTLESRDDIEALLTDLRAFLLQRLQPNTRLRLR